MAEELKAPIIEMPKVKEPRYLEVPPWGDERAQMLMMGLAIALLGLIISLK